MAEDADRVGVEERAPDRAEVAEIRELVAAATAADGVAPVSEPVLLDLGEHGDPRARHLLARHHGTLVGYAHLDDTDLVAGPSAELAVHPAYRRHGVATALLRALEAADPGRRLRLWAHGRRPAALAFAASHHYLPERVLHQLRRPLTDIPDAPLPAGIRLRAFRPGEDETAWVGVNNRAFAGHPDQADWTVEDLLAREAEPWFDPAGFLLAERADGRLAGFHWTKVHPDDPPMGEVYVLGVDPSARGLALGPALTVAGLRHLRDRGLAGVLLYVDESNPRAVRLYERLGFRLWESDVQFRRGRGDHDLVHPAVG